ncbi:YolD-like family protein [Paenibacillus agricola]|uniref:YolD-like family protein n=1 Tax=Paenibacillus agricola TaxID=2716264 RepID=A0ABX0J5G3_9BACL|nr:YolD-like family protein [Paenibacillus agricola]
MKQAPSKKLEGNGHWESSRMVLPEHVIALNRHDKDKLRITKPILTEDEQENIFGLIRSTRACCLPVTLTCMVNSSMR